MPALIAWWTLDLEALHPCADPDVVLELGTDLLRRWAKPQRHYHSTRHLVEVFWALDDLAGPHGLLAHEQALCRVAGWFHDAVYDPRAAAGHNEAASARLAVASLERLGMPAADIATVETLVLMTDGHDVAHTAPAQAFHDADLWILSAPTERFDAYCAQVREEYAHVPNPLYRQARSRILDDFVHRPQLYVTGFAQAEWDTAARDNLRRELARLS